MKCKATYTHRDFLTLSRLSHDILIVLDLQYHLLDINPAAEKYLDWQKANVMGQKFLDINTHSGLEALFVDMDYHFLTEHPMEGVECKITVKGEERIVQWAMICLLNEEHTPKSLLLIGTPVTVTYKDDSLSALLFSQLPGFASWKDIHGRYITCNLRFAKSLGLLHPDDIAGKTDAELFSEHDARLLQEHDAIALKMLSPKTFEESLTFPQQAPITLLAERVVLCDSKRTPLGILCVFMDITDLKYTESSAGRGEDGSLNSSEQLTAIYLQNIITHLPGLVYWKNREGLLLGCNETVAANAGLATTQLIIGKKDYDFSWKDSANTWRENENEVMQTGKTIQVEEIVTLPNKEIRTYMASKAPLRDNKGNIIGTMGISLDITDRKRIEKELQEAKVRAETANYTKSEFIANMSHDLRTPLNAILGMSEILKMREHLPAQREFIDGIMQAGLLISNLVEDVLSFSKIEAGRIEIKFTSFDLYALLEDIKQTCSHQLTDDNVKLVLSIPKKLPQYITSDEKMLRRIVMNFVSNAIKFTEQGRIIISADVADLSDDTYQLHLSVEDTGIGIDADDLNHVFDRFYRVEPSYKGLHRGSGLGLAIVKQFVKDLQGQIGVNSEKGKGSTFWCTIPVKAATLVTDPLQDLTAIPDEALPMLLIDDHIRRGNILARTLHPNACTLTKSSQALKILKQAAHEKQPFRIVLIDDEIKSRTPLTLIHEIRTLTAPDTLILLLGRPATLPLQAQAPTDFMLIPKPSSPKEIRLDVIATYEKWAQTNSSSLRENERPRVRVLLVDDNTLGQKISSSMLEELKCDVDIAASGMEALAHAQKRYDIIFLDIGLPDISGFDVAERIIAETPNASTPIIALTAHAAEEDKQRCLAIGMIDFIAKPASFSDFKQRIKSLVLPSS